MNYIFFTLVVLFSSTITVAQKDAGLKNLLTKDKVIQLPTNISAISKKLNFKARIQKTVDVPGGSWWDLSSGVRVSTFVESKKESINLIDFFLYKDYDTTVISGLPYNLIFNKTTFEACRNIFENDLVVVSEKEDGTLEVKKMKALLKEEDGTYRFTFKRGKLYGWLRFNEKNILTFIRLSTVPGSLIPAG